MQLNKLLNPKNQKYKAAMVVSDLIHLVPLNSLEASQKGIQMMKMYRPQSIFSVELETRHKNLQFNTFRFFLKGVQIFRSRGVQIYAGRVHTPLHFPRTAHSQTKKRRHLAISNITKCLYFSGFLAILSLPFVSNLQFTFPHKPCKKHPPLQI